MRKPITKIETHFVVNTPATAHRVEGTREVVFRDRTPFRLVGIEERIRRPTLEHPTQLPAQVEPVGNRGVHPGATARSHPVRSVADQECVTGSEAVGDRPGEGEGVLIDYSYGKVCYAGASPDPVDHLLLGERGPCPALQG